MVIVNGHPGVIERAINNVDDMDEVENKAVDANGRIIGHQLLQHDLIRLRQDNLGKVVQNQRQAQRKTETPIFLGVALFPLCKNEDGKDGADRGHWG